MTWKPWHHTRSTLVYHHLHVKATWNCVTFAKLHKCQATRRSCSNALDVVVWPFQLKKSKHVFSSRVNFVTSIMGDLNNNGVMCFFGILHLVSQPSFTQATYIINIQENWRPSLCPGKILPNLNFVDVPTAVVHVTVVGRFCSTVRKASATSISVKLYQTEVYNPTFFIERQHWSQ